MVHKLQKIAKLKQISFVGYVTLINGLLIEASGLESFVSVGSKCTIKTRDGRQILAEVIALDKNTCKLMPFSDLQGLGVGCEVHLLEENMNIFPHHSWLGRVINAFGIPIDDKGYLQEGDDAYKVKNAPPNAHKRAKVEGKIDLGVRAINTFLSCCKGQRMGIFAGSGVGKSMLVSMLTKFAEADVKVIGLIGERGRELHEFLHKYLGEEGLKKAVTIVATSDESALMRRLAAYTTMAVAEYFRDQGKHVLCIMDSVTRFAMAQREIGLSAGEPPATKGYTPTVFSEMPKLLERAGPGEEGSGWITGLFTVLVEGDDHNEPISDAVRGILDGHIVLDRSIGDRGRYPAINILKSVSRTMPGCNSEKENNLVFKAKKQLSLYEDMAEMIRLGAYNKGSNEELDVAIKLYPKLEQFLHQKPDEIATLDSCYKGLEKILAENQ